MFSDFNLTSIMLDNKSRNKKAFVRFNHEEDVAKILTDMPKFKLDGKYVTLRPCTQEEVDKMFPPEFPLEQIEDHVEQIPEPVIIPQTNSVNAPSKTIHLSGLPKKSTDRDIIDFFSDIGVIPAKIEMLKDEAGFNGEAKCEFFNNDDALLGYQKKGMPFGSGIVNMNYVLPEVIEIIEDSSPVLIPPPPQPPRLNFMPPPQPLLQKPFIQGFNQQGNGIPPQGALLRMPLRPPFFQPRGGFGGGPRGGPRAPPPLLMGGHPPRMGGRGMGHRPRFPPMKRETFTEDNFMEVEQESTEFPEEIGEDEELGPPGCVLLMENVPYKAGIEEILGFLEGYEISPDNVLRKYTSNGLPSGETKVIFDNPQVVYHIIQEKKGQRIRERSIYLTQI